MWAWLTGFATRLLEAISSAVIAALSEVVHVRVVAAFT